MSYAKLLDDTARRVPHKVALVCRGERWSYSACDVMTRRVATGLAAAGVRPGERIALHMLNCVGLAVLYFAWARLGAVAVPVNIRLKAPEVDFVLRHGGAVAYIGDTAIVPQALLDPEPRRSLRQVFLLGDAARSHSYAELLAIWPSTPLPDVDLDQPATIIYTSGSTARPKGVVYSHRAVTAGAERGQPGIASDAVVVQATSMIHADGFSNLIAAVRAGARFILLPSFDADQVLGAIEEHRCTYFAGLPFMFEELVERQRARPRDVANASTFHAGGEVTERELIGFLRRQLAGYKVPERIWFRTTLPRSRGGKLQRGLLRDQLLSEFAGAA